MTGPLVLKLGGELIETATARAAVAAMVAGVRTSRPVAVVHGGGRAIDAELARRQIAPKKVDGIRITDAPTRDAVVAVLGGTANTELVAQPGPMSTSAWSATPTRWIRHLPNC
jgi:acetylglutamate kinase